MTSNAELAEKYKKLDEISHVLQLSDTYVGSIEKVNADVWLYDDATTTIVQKNIVCNFGLYKIFDEAIVNARDHHVRTEQAILEAKINESPVNQISIDVSQETGTIRVTNNGTAIPIEIHPEHNIYIPQLIFANMRSSSNYNTEEKRITGGRNGLGIKLAFIFSTYAKVEIVDAITKKKYTQEYKNNLRDICPPVIEKLKGSIKSSVSIEFLPDYTRFGFATLPPDMLAMFKKRVFDIAAVTNKNVKVSFNGELLPVKTFKQYISMYIGDDKFAYEENGERWEYAVALSPTNEFSHVSLVNGLATRIGGKHVEYILNQITKKVADYIEKKKKVSVKSTAIKEQLMLFLRCDIENPAFDSQTKDCMTTPVSKFGTVCAVSDAFCEKIAKMGVMEQACSVTEARENRIAAKKTDGTKTRVIRGIANYIDANFAGTDKSGECTLILCEGLSAQSGVVSGLSSTDRNFIGIYPLKGKVLNVRGETTKKIADNKEITDLKKILGLENGRIYTENDVKSRLRYGKVMFLTDADPDGSHIKALCVNLFHCEWTSLIKIAGFLSFMNTPILRATRGKQTISFYHEGEYETWKHDIGENAISAWKIKYFKGLGTSTAAEFKEYFANKKQVDFIYTDEQTDNKIDQIFNKKRADERKTWLENYDKEARLDTSNPQVTYEEFIDRELIHFSVYDCERSIPNLMDGLKISLRKILYCSFKRRLTAEVKVAQFAGYVSEHSMYHHGENSLLAAIVNMAQDFVGSNNINLLEPKGQFGGRLQGGDDAASPRYIFTQLNELTRILFPETDDQILTFINDDGTMVEPEFYLPIIPFVLVNGGQGIGTGFSTSIPCYNPLDLVGYLRTLLGDAAAAAADTENIPAPVELVPYYEGFKGTIRKITDTKYLIKGCYNKIADDKIVITELPVGTWTMPYITFLEELMDPPTAPATATGGAKKKAAAVVPVVKDIVNLSTETNIQIQVQFARGKLQELEEADHIDYNGVEKLLKLATTVSTTNMHLFTAELKLKKYATVDEIIRDYYVVRLAAYERRKAYLLENLKYKVKIMTNKARYIQAVLDDVIDLRRKTAEQVYQMLQGGGFEEIDNGYKYLTKLPMDSVSVENVANILQEKENTEREYNTLFSTTEKQLWLNELAEFEDKYSKYKETRNTKQIGDDTGAAKKKTTVKVIKKVAAAKKSAV
jgi:DNA topoisomerase-2